MRSVLGARPAHRSRYGAVLVRSAAPAAHRRAEARGLPRSSENDGANHSLPLATNVTAEGG